MDGTTQADERDLQIVKDRTDGLSFGALAAKYGLTRQRVQQITEARGVPRFHAKSQAVAEETAAMVKEYHEGSTAAQIADRYGKLLCTVQMRLYKARASIKSRQLWDKIAKKLIVTSGCWGWRGEHLRNGYCAMRNRPKGRTFLVHRLTYEELIGPIPPGLHIDHLCRERSCVNPFHCEPTSCAENIKRGLLGGPREVCKQGHPLDAQNTYIRRSTGDRRCRTCQRALEARRPKRVHKNRYIKKADRGA